MTLHKGSSYSALAASLLLLVAGCVQEASPPEFAFQVTQLPAVGINGSLAPYLATGADATVVMSWVEPQGEGHALRFATLQNGVWGLERTVASGDNWFVNWADFPSVVPISGDVWASHWLERQPAGGYAYDVHMALSHDSGDSWSEPIVAHTDNTETEHGFVSFFPQEDGVGFVYLDGRKQANEFTDDPIETGMTLRAASLTVEGSLRGQQLVDNLICDCCQTDVSMTIDGPVAVYRNRTVGEIRDIYVTRKISGEWTKGVALHDDGWEIPGCPVNGPDIFAHGADVVVAWFTAADDVPKVKFARSKDSGKSFSAPIEIASGELLGHVGITVDGNGDAWVIWQARAGDGQVELAMRRVSASGNLGAVHTVAPKGGLSAFSVPQIVRQADRLILAWTEGEYGETEVISASIEIPNAH